LENQLGKEPIESGMSKDGSDTIPGHVPYRDSAENLEKIEPAE